MARATPVALRLLALVAWLVYAALGSFGEWIPGHDPPLHHSATLTSQPPYYEYMRVGEDLGRSTYLRGVGNSTWPQPSDDWPELPEQTRMERRQARSWNRWLVVKIVGGSLLAMIMAGFAFGPFAFMMLLAFPFVLLALYERSRLSTVARDEWLVEQPDQDEFLVDALVEVDGVVRGMDRGIVWFDKASVEFSGQRCWFRIGAQDVALKGEFAMPPFTRSELTTKKATLALRTSGPKVRIKFECDPRQGPGAQEALNDALFRFRHSGMSSLEPTKLPPLGIDPDYHHNIWRDTEVFSWPLPFLAALPLVIAFLPVLADYALYLYPIALTATIYGPAARIIAPAATRATLRRRRRLSEQ